MTCRVLEVHIWGGGGVCVLGGGGVALWILKIIVDITILLCMLLVHKPFQIFHENLKKCKT